MTKRDGGPLRSKSFSAGDSPIPPGATSAGSRSDAKKPVSVRRGLFGWFVVITGAVAVALIVQATTAQAYWIPSTSMETTLHVDDRVLVNKWSYRLHSIHRGDIVVFARPKDMASADKDLIKRVIGLPGEKITIANGHVYVNNHALVEPYVNAGNFTEVHPGRDACTPQAPCLIPKGDIWVMGDNRLISEDSRYFGPIPESSVVGRAFFRIWPLNRLGSL
jgi:signal peptidase I